GVDHLRGEFVTTEGAGCMREANSVVGKLQVAEQVHLAATPGTAVAVLVGSQVFEDRNQRFAVRIGGILQSGVRAAGHTKGVVRSDVAVEHKAVVGRVGNVAAEFT